MSANQQIPTTHAGAVKLGERIAAGLQKPPNLTQAPTAIRVTVTANSGKK